MNTYSLQAMIYAFAITFIAIGDSFLSQDTIMSMAVLSVLGLVCGGFNSWKMQRSLIELDKWLEPVWSVMDKMKSEGKEVPELLDEGRENLKKETNWPEVIKGSALGLVTTLVFGVTVLSIHNHVLSDFWFSYAALLFITFCWNSVVTTIISYVLDKAVKSTLS